MANPRGIAVNGKYYNLERSELICKTPDGILYRKFGPGRAFFLYNQNGKVNKEKFIDVSWAEANNIVKTYGTREQHLDIFTAYSASTDWHDGKSTSLRLDEYHRIKAQRNADRRKMNLTQYIKFLIDKDDESQNCYR